MIPKDTVSATKQTRISALREAQKKVMAMAPTNEQRADLWYDGYDSAITDVLEMLTALEGAS